MSAENKAIVQRYYAEGLTKGNVAAIENLIADDIVAHAPGFPVIEGRAAFLNAIRTFREAFTDFYGVIEDVVAEGGPRPRALDGERDARQGICRHCADRQSHDLDRG
jgi:ketosteroid isomerase-like protein